jgi:hypothetical protein
METVTTDDSVVKEYNPYREAELMGEASLSSLPPSLSPSFHPLQCIAGACRRLAEY